MDALTATIDNCNLELRLDNNTEGNGNCFPNAIVQQCRRPEIKKWIQTNNPNAFVANQYSLRRKVTAFALNSTQKTVQEYKRNFESIIPGEHSWIAYWEKMGQTGTWVDSSFVQVTAWFIGLDILILTTSSKEENPYIRIEGNLNLQYEGAMRPHMLLGNYTNVHYQSLLPLSLFEKKIQQQKKESSSKITEGNDHKREDYIYIHNEEQVTFLSLENEKLRCPFCLEAFQRIVNHVKNKKCEISKLKIDTVEFTNQLKSFKEGFRLEVGRAGNKRVEKS